MTLSHNLFDSVIIYKNIDIIRILQQSILVIKVTNMNKLPNNDLIDYELDDECTINLDVDFLSDNSDYEDKEFFSRVAKRSSITIQKNQKWKLIHRLKQLSKPYKNISDLWDQWEIVNCYMAKSKNRKRGKGKKIEADSWNTHNFAEEDGYARYSCLCSHTPILDLNYIENKLTGHRCIIGSKCIDKFGSNKLKVSMKSKIGELLGKIYCVVCDRKLLDKCTKPYHKSCYAAFLENQKCAICNKSMTDNTRTEFEGKYFHRNCYDVFLRDRRCTICNKLMPYCYEVDQVDHKECLNPDLIRYCPVCDKQLDYCEYSYNDYVLAHDMCYNRKCTVCNKILPITCKQESHDACTNRKCIICHEILPSEYKIQQIAHILCLDPPKCYCTICHELLPSNYNQSAHELCINPPKRNCLLCKELLPEDCPRGMNYHKSCFKENTVNNTGDYRYVNPPNVNKQHGYIDPYTGKRKF